MISINYQLSSYTHFLQQVAAALHTTVSEDTVLIPEVYGTGFFRVITVNDGIEALIYNIYLKQDLLFKRERGGKLFAIIFEDIEAKDGFSFSIGKDVLEDNNLRSTAMYLTSFLYDVEYVLHKNAALKGFRVLHSEPWMQQYLQLSENEDVLEKYINLKTAGLWYRPVDDEMKSLLEEIVTQNDIPLLFFQNKIMRLIESFFSWLYDEMKVLSTKSGISKMDIEAAQKIEAIITEDVTSPPPTIKELAREAAMSESKLKKIFKVVYEFPPYEYFQKHRMIKAMHLLQSGDYAIKDVGYTLGYSNLSNFTLAFKKEFGTLPSNILKGRAK